MAPVMRRLYNKPEFIVLLARLKLLSFIGHPQQWEIDCWGLNDCIDWNAIIPYGVVAWDIEMDADEMYTNAANQVAACGITGAMPADSTKFFNDLRKEAFILSQKIWPALGTQQPGAFQASLNIEEIRKIHDDLLDNWHDCLIAQGYPDSFANMLYDPVFVSSLSENESIIPFDNVGDFLAEKLIASFMSDKAGRSTAVPQPPPTNPVTTIGPVWAGVSQQISPEDMVHAICLMDEQLLMVEEFFVANGFSLDEAIEIKYQSFQILAASANNDDGANPNHINWFQGTLEDINGALEQAIAHLPFPQDHILAISSMPEFATLITQLQLMADIGDPENKDDVNKDQLKNIDWNSIIPSGTTVNTYDPTSVLTNAEAHIEAAGGIVPAGLPDEINRTYDELLNIAPHQFPGTTAAPVNPEAANWQWYIDGAMGPGWELDMIRIELQLRALHQWGEGSEPGFTTIEDFCAFDFSQIISCDAGDPANYDPGHVGAVIADLGFPHAIYEKLNESENVNAHPTGAPPEPWCPYSTHDGCGCPPGKAWNYKGECVDEGICYEMMCPPGEYWQTCYYGADSGYREENNCEAGFGNYHNHGCFEQCVCQYGWWRHPDGHCVQSGHECPIPPPCEEENTAYTDCAGYCEPNCDGWSCYDHWCEQGCACADGFIR